jgi:glycosyltransferase involved in cell wall biosynthesis
MIDHGRDGWLVGAGDAGALADGIRRLLQDGALWTRMSTAGRIKVAARFDRQKTLPQLFEVFMDASQEPYYSHSAPSVAVQA